MMADVDQEAGIRAAFRQQAAWCRELGSPFTARVLDLAADRLDRSSAVGHRVLDWTGLPGSRFDAVPLRLAGGLHALARRGASLSASYPPHVAPEDGVLWRAIRSALDEPDLLPWLDSAPQTNEVARSAILMAGLMTVAHRTGLPLSLFELGSSAGLNLQLDRYAYRFGPLELELEAGAPGSPLVLAPEWRGPAPQRAAVRVVARRGVDLNPLDVMCAADCERLLAYIWADQVHRIARTEAAIEIARREPPMIDRGDAAAWIRHAVGTPQAGLVQVVMHSIAFQYFPEPSRSRIAAHLADVGASATAAAPLAWLRFEVDGRYGERPSLILTLWPGGEERRLGQGSAHGLWVEWEGS